MIKDREQEAQDERKKRLLEDINKAGGVENFVKKIAAKHKAWVQYQEKKIGPQTYKRIVNEK